MRYLSISKIQCSSTTLLVNKCKSDFVSKSSSEQNTINRALRNVDEVCNLLDIQLAITMHINNDISKIV